MAGRTVAQHIVPRVDDDRWERETLRCPRLIAEAMGSSGASVMSARRVVRTERIGRREEVHWARTGICVHASLGFWKRQRAAGFGRQCRMRHDRAARAWNTRPRQLGKAARSRI